MKQLFSTLPRNIIGCFKGPMIRWHVLAMLLTLILVTSGLDWRYFASTRNPILRSCMFPAVLIGGLVPIDLPLVLLAIGGIPEMRRSPWPGGLLARQNSSALSSLLHINRLPGGHIPRTALAPISATSSDLASCAAGSSGVGHPPIRQSRSQWRPQYLRSSQNNGGSAIWRSSTLFTSASASP